MQRSHPSGPVSAWQRGLRISRRNLTYSGSVSLAACLIACQEMATRLPSIDAQGAGIPAQAVQAIRDSMQSLVTSGTIPGAALLLARHGAIVEVVTVGFADRESGTHVQRNSIFRLASATKIWISAAALTLVDEGRIGLDDPVSRFLPEFATLRVHGDSGRVQPARRAVTVRDLLRHTSGMGYGYADPYQAALVAQGLLMHSGRFGRDWSHPWSLAEWTRRLATVPLEAEPGTVFSYGLSHDVVGRLIEVVSGQRLPAFVSQRMLEPLGLHDTGFALDAARLDRLTSFYVAQPEGFVRVETGRQSPFREAPQAPSGGGGWDQPGNGGLVTTIDDFARFLQMLLNDGELDGVRVLSAASVAAMRANQLAGIGTGDSFWPGVGFGFGHAVLYDASRFDGPGMNGKFWWAGSTNAYFWADPALQFIGVFLTHLLPFGHADVMSRVEQWAYDAIDIGK
jgi:CubicO group peptidase (beta-lactamase class C family)